MPDLKYLFSWKRNLQQPDPPEIKPRNSKRQMAQEETAGFSRARTGPEEGKRSSLPSEVHPASDKRSCIVQCSDRWYLINFVTRKNTSV
jgi:hypothetical protein